MGSNWNQMNMTDQSQFMHQHYHAGYNQSYYEPQYYPMVPQQSAASSVYSGYSPATIQQHNKLQEHVTPAFNEYSSVEGHYMENRVFQDNSPQQHFTDIQSNYNSPESIIFETEKEETSGYRSRTPSTKGRRGNSTEKRPSTGNQEKDEQIEIRRINNRIHQRMKRDKDKAQQEAENERDKQLDRLLEKADDIDNRRIEELRSTLVDNQKRRAELEEVMQRTQSYVNHEQYYLELLTALKEYEKKTRVIKRELEKNKVESKRKRKAEKDSLIHEERTKTSCTLID